MRLRPWVFLLLLASSIAVFSGVRMAIARPQATPVSQDWPVWNGSPDNLHYSSLAQIDRSNVKQLQLAWSYDTGEKGGMQTSPLVVGRVLYGLSPTQKVLAVDAATGKLIWTFDSGIKGLQPD